MFEAVNEKFPDLRCATCGAALPLGTKCRVKVDVSGWLIYATCLTCK
jgi:RNase P subunit RPR2